MRPTSPRHSFPRTIHVAAAASPRLSTTAYPRRGRGAAAIRQKHIRAAKGQERAAVRLVQFVHDVLPVAPRRRFHGKLVAVAAGRRGPARDGRAAVAAAPATKLGETKPVVGHFDSVVALKVVAKPGRFRCRSGGAPSRTFRPTTGRRRTTARPRRAPRRRAPGPHRRCARRACPCRRRPRTP